MSCPPVEKLLEFAAGSLPDAAAAEIESHIDDCFECRGALSNFARGDAPPSFGRYRIDTVLGSGGMGIVYRAWDPQLARPIAIKVVRRGGEDTQGRARLVREAQALARLSHPNVCHVYDVGTDGDEVWVAMELIDGMSLRQWADQARTREELLDVLLGAATGIAAAHEAGLVHRDIKPENVLIRRDGRAVVTDFGLARNQDRIDPNASTLSTDPRLTMTGAIAGTPAYIAPEQLTGEPLDARVDQFAWAVMAWELLVGARPFPIVFATRLEAVQHGVTAPATLPAHIGTALARAMAYVSRDRFPSMRELIEAMRDRPSVPMQSRKRRGPAIAGIAVLGATAVAIGAWTVAHGHTQPAPTVAAPELAPSAPSAAPPPVVETPAIAQVPAPAPVAKIPTSRPSPQRKPPPNHDDLAPSAPSTTTTLPTHPVMPSGHYCRSCMVGVMDMECRIPIDPTYVTGSTFAVADWGKVTKVQDEPGQFRDQSITRTVITVAGQRSMYRFDADFLDEHLDANVGDLLAVCPEDSNNNTYQLSGGATIRTHSIITISHPPRTAEIAKLDPIHIAEITMVAEGLEGRFRAIDPDRRYLIYATVKKPDGPRWLMDRYFMEVPANVPGTNQIAAGKHLWIVVEHPRFETDSTGAKHLVVDAAYVLGDLFP
jgi:serine/threonine-protein kinase